MNDTSKTHKSSVMFRVCKNQNNILVFLVLSISLSWLGGSIDTASALPVVSEQIKSDALLAQDMGISKDVDIKFREKEEASTSDIEDNQGKGSTQFEQMGEVQEKKTRHQLVEDSNGESGLGDAFKTPPQKSANLRSGSSLLLAALAEIEGVNTELVARSDNNEMNSNSMASLFEEQVVIASRMEKERETFRKVLKQRSSTEAEAENFDRMTTEEISDLYYFTCFSQACSDINDCQSYGCSGSCLYNAQMGYNSCQGGGNRNFGYCGAQCGNYYRNINSCGEDCPYCVGGICSRTNRGFTPQCYGACNHSGDCDFVGGCGICNNFQCVPGHRGGYGPRNSCNNPCTRSLDCTDGPCYACNSGICV